MNQDKYNDAWTILLAARRVGDLEAVHHAAEALAHAARVMLLEKQQPLKPCSHFMVANGHCIECGKIIEAVSN